MEFCWKIYLRGMLSLLYGDCCDSLSCGAIAEICDAYGGKIGTVFSVLTRTSPFKMTRKISCFFSALRAVCSSRETRPCNCPPLCLCGLKVISLTVKAHITYNTQEFSSLSISMLSVRQLLEQLASLEKSQNY